MLRRDRKQLRIHFHLGAHKTATSHLQRILALNQVRLADQGVFVSVPADLRKAWLPAFLKYCRRSIPFVRLRRSAKLRSLAPERGLWVVSEENLIGVCRNLAHHSGLYSKAPRRIAILREIFHSIPLRFFFSIRSYESYYLSAYQEVVRSNKFMPFDQFYDPDRFAGNSWHELIHSIAAIVPQESIVLWRYEDYAAILPSLLSELTEVDHTEQLLAGFGPAATRPSLSARSIEALRHQAESGQDLPVGIIGDLERRFPLGEENPRYDPFDAAVKSELRARYAQDFQAIRRDFPRIRVLTPTADTAGQA